MNGFFITGSDTSIGKTHVASCILRELKTLGANAVPFKPVASGSGTDEDGVNSDIQSLTQASGYSGDIHAICPYLFKPLIAPHFAAEMAAKSIELATIIKAFDCLTKKYEIIVVEGAGGWRVPISVDQDMQSLAIALNLPVIVVIGIRLGCINHGLLTLEAVARSGVPIAGWVANYLENDRIMAEKNVGALQARSPISFLGNCNYGSRNIIWAPKFSLAEWINS